MGEGGTDEVFAPLSIDGVASVGLLAKRACAEFPRWGADAGQVHLLLVKQGGRENPTAEEEASAEALDKPAYTLADAHVASGSWLLARVSMPAAAAGASCGTHTFLAPASSLHRRPRSRSPPFLLSTQASLKPPWMYR